MQKFALVIVGAVALAGLAAPEANAAGCLRGAVAGGVIGHFAGHHGLLGAGVGCLYEHHREARHEREFRDDRDRY